MLIATGEATTNPLLTGNDVLAVSIGVGVLALVVVLLPVLLSRTFKRPAEPAGNGKGRPGNFFEIDYITWFLVHYGIASLSILAIVLLGVDNVIDKGTVSALLGGLFGYVLGTSSHGVTAAKDKPVSPKAAAQVAAEVTAEGDGEKKETSEAAKEAGGPAGA